MLTIQNDIFISLIIDGTEVEYAGIQNITLCEGNGVLCPTMMLDLADPKSLLASSHALSDGNTVEIMIARSAKDNSVGYRKYRVFGPVRNNNAYNPSLKFVALLNAPKFVTASVQESYSGTTDDVLRDLAGRSGLTYSGPSSVNGRQTNDRQDSWLNVCKNRMMFMAETVRHGWMDKQSGMSVTVTSYGEIRYRNLTDVINTPAEKIKFVFMHNARATNEEGDKKTYWVKEAHDKSTAGFMATAMNYGSTRVHNNLDGKPKQIKNLAVKTPGAYLALNKEVADMVKKSRYDYAPIDCGNTHDNYQDAEYQNLKILALFTERMSLLVTDVTEVQLYEPVIYRQADSDPNAPVRNTDIYLVIGKTVVVRSGIHYAERIELARMSLTMKGQTSLQGPSSVGSESALMPDVTINKNTMGSSVNPSMPVVRSVTGLNGGVADVFHALNSMTGLSNSATSGVASSVAGLANALKSGTGIESAIASTASSALNAVGVMGNFQSLSSLSTTRGQSLISSIGQMPASARIAVLTQTAGVLPSVANQMRFVTQAARVASLLTSSVKSLTPNLQRTDDARSLATSANQSQYLVQQLSSQIAGLWNEAVLCMQGQQRPTVLQKTNLPVRLDTMMQSNNTDDEIDQIIQEESLRTNATSANLLEDDAFVPKIESALDTSLRYVSNMVSRNEATA